MVSLIIGPAKPRSYGFAIVGQSVSQSVCPSLIYLRNVFSHEDGYDTLFFYKHNAYTHR